MEKASTVGVDLFIAHSSLLTTIRCSHWQNSYKLDDFWVSQYYPKEDSNLWMSEIIKVLKNGSRLLISHMESLSFLPFCKNKRSWEHWATAEHLRCRTPDPVVNKMCHQERAQLTSLGGEAQEKHSTWTKASNTNEEDLQGTSRKEREMQLN